MRSCSRYLIRKTARQEPKLALLQAHTDARSPCGGPECLYSGRNHEWKNAQTWSGGMLLDGCNGSLESADIQVLSNRQERRCADKAQLRHRHDGWWKRSG